MVRRDGRKGGIAGRPVELVVHDDESVPARAGELYERLIRQDEVDLLLGPCHSEMVEGITDLLERERRLLLQGSGSSHELFRKSVTAIGSCDSDLLRDYLLHNSFATVMGELRFQENGLPSATMQLSQLVDGKVRIVYPEIAKTGDPVLG